MHLHQTLAALASGDGNGSGSPYQLVLDSRAMTHVQFPDYPVLCHPGNDVLRSLHEQFGKHRICQAVRNSHEVAVETVFWIRFHFYVLEFRTGGFMDDAL